MGMISWSDDTFQLHYADETIALLPKEYALLQFLYTWKNRTFSRQDLLDRVWPLEEPTDRTVDDHIYRLRRKLQKWSPLLTIETVRGVGYRLNWKQNQSPQPSALNRDFSDNVRSMLETYHGMGMGAAMQTLAAHQEVLGIQIDPFYEKYMRFISGDFAWFVENMSFPLSEKLFYLFHIFYMTETDVHRSLELLEKLRSYQEQMPASYANELEIVAIAMYVQTEQWQKAEDQLEKARAIVEKMDSPSFTLFLQTGQTLLYVYSDRLDEAEAVIRRSAEILQLLPMQRELGSLTIQRGLCLYRRQERSKARRAVDEGLEVILSTKFVPHQIYAVQLILSFLNRYDCDQEWKRKYERHWARLTEEYQFDSVKKTIAAAFARTI